ncbi:MAG: hypothetical protein LLG02_11530 [Pelosinus sp.]|nr:hypothetical protein [Pelosinus sp.]
MFFDLRKKRKIQIKDLKEICRILAVYNSNEVQFFTVAKKASKILPFTNISSRHASVAEDI